LLGQDAGMIDAPAGLLRRAATSELHLPEGVGAHLPGTLLAVLAAVLFGVGSVLQHEGVVAARRSGGLGVRSLVRQRVWVAGQSTTVAGSLTHVAALALAPVGIVQPVLAGALVVALLVRTLRTGHRLGRGELAGAALTVAGLAVFLAAARPAPGESSRLPAWQAVVAAVLLVLLVVALAARFGHGSTGALGCGVTGGLAAGVAAVLVSAAFKVVGQSGVGHALTGPEVAGAVIAAVAAQVGAQQAYSRGSLSWSLPALVVVDPAAALPAARVLLGERLEPGHAPVWGPAGLVAVLGIVLLTRSEEHPHREARTG
jgi:drug/metabolite transporter (DMT)-like permease